MHRDPLLLSRIDLEINNTINSVNFKPRYFLCLRRLKREFKIK